MISEQSACMCAAALAAALALFSAGCESSSRAGRPREISTLDGVAALKVESDRVKLTCDGASPLRGSAVALGPAGRWQLRPGAALMLGGDRLQREYELVAIEGSEAVFKIRTIGRRAESYPAATQQPVFAGDQAQSESLVSVRSYGK